MLVKIWGLRVVCIPLQGPDKADLFLYALEGLPQQNYPYQVCMSEHLRTECTELAHRLDDYAPWTSPKHTRALWPTDWIYPGVACQLYMFSAGGRHAWSVLALLMNRHNRPSRTTRPCLSQVLCACALTRRKELISSCRKSD